MTLTHSQGNLMHIRTESLNLEVLKLHEERATKDALCPEGSSCWCACFGSDVTKRLQIGLIRTAHSCVGIALPWEP